MTDLQRVIRGRAWKFGDSVDTNQLARGSSQLAADEDLKGIAVYTISKWGPKQALLYGAFLDAHFEAIGAGKARRPAEAVRIHPDRHFRRITQC